MKFFKQLRVIFMAIFSVIYLLLGIAPIQAYAGPTDYMGEYTWPNIPGTNTDKALDQWHIHTRSDSDGDTVRENEQVNSTGNWDKWIWSKYSVTTEGNKTTIIIEDLQLKSAFAVDNNIYSSYYMFVFPGVKEVWTRHNTWGATVSDTNYSTLKARGFTTTKEQNDEKNRIYGLNSSHYDGTWTNQTESYMKNSYLKEYSYSNGYNVSQDTKYKYNHFARRISLKLVYENLTEIPKISASSFSTRDSSGGSSGPTAQGSTIRLSEHHESAHYILAENEAISSITGTQGFSSTVKFNANGGSVNETTRTVAAGAAIGNLPTATRTGYSLNGWYTAASGGSKIDANTKVNGDATYYAQWTPTNYSINYNLNGGTNNSSNPSSYNIATATITLKDPTRTGYIFGGWYSDSGLTSRVYTINKGSTGNKTFYAKWTPRTDTKYVVKHQIQNVDGNGYTLQDTDNLKGTSDTSVTPATKTYTGFTAPSKQTVTINADGTRVVTYNYTRNKYKFTMGVDTGVSTSGSTANGSYYYGETITLKATPSNGYEWEKWSNGDGNQISSVTMPAGDLTIAPEVHPITYTITYKLNGGKVDYKKVNYNVETPTFYIENPTKKGYNFTGWTGTGITGTTTDLSVPKGSYGNKTFEATWGNGVYAISFDGNGATSGSMETITVKSGESVRLPENGFVRDGYSFVGWYTTKEDRFGTFYKNGAEITDLTESITLHAQWKKDRDKTGDNDNGNTGDNSGNGSGDNGSGNGGNNGDNGNGNNRPGITPKDELGYFGTSQRRNEISLLTTLGMQDKKLTLNYNY